MEVVIVGIMKLLEEGGIGVALKALGGLALMDWVRQNPQIAIGALSVVVVGIAASVTKARQT
ncbi:MAG: hypothetical protein ACLQE9_16470 [Roseiarcus sp.]